MRPTRDRILDEGRDQLLASGYDGFSVASVRDALGLSSGSMFHAFASKAALAAAIYVEGMADYQRTALAALETAAPAGGRVRALVSAHLGWIEDRRLLARLLFETQPEAVSHEAETGLRSHNEDFFSRLDAFYRELEDEGLMGPVARPVAHAVCIGPAQEYARQWVRDVTLPPPREVDRLMADAAIAGLARTLPERTRPRAR